MTTDYHDWGMPIQPDEYHQLPAALSNLGKACDEFSAFELLEYRKGDVPNQYLAVLDVSDGTFDIDNEAGILRVERIAVSYNPDSDHLPWDVRALRTDFPVTLHQNDTKKDEPISLCLYINDWKSVERSWTPELFLHRILWWLRSTAEGNIHAADQPIEQLFFTSPYVLLLPPDNEGKFGKKEYRLVFQSTEHHNCKIKTFRGEYIEAGIVDKASCQSISICVPPIDNNPVQTSPGNLGELEQYLTSLDSGLLDPLKSAIESIVDETGIPVSHNPDLDFLLIIVGIPRVRDEKVERLDMLGFGLRANIGDLGEALGVLNKSPTDNNWYKTQFIGGFQADTDDGWKAITIDPYQIQLYPTAEKIRRISGIDQDDHGPKGIIAGVGSLGSALAEIWNREAWGNWLYVDDDLVQAHNLPRHLATDYFIGTPKTLAVRTFTQNTFLTENDEPPEDYTGSILDNEASLDEAKASADLIVDVTTTLHVPRDLSEINHSPRLASVFFTPSGMASVMLLEDGDRATRSSHLEAQYYRAILNSGWGKYHLTGHSGQFWVGAGCRDVSSVISNELVQIHAATLARQLRKSVNKPDARICIWDYDDESGGLHPIEVPVYPVRSVSLGDWKVLWDVGFEDSISIERTKKLPNETGGILRGLVDQKTKTMYLVDWSEQPIDSFATPSSFNRGQKGQDQIIMDGAQRTAGIVSYIGDWHSHPPRCAAAPSQYDQKLLMSLSEQLLHSGTPALMLIVGEMGLGFCIQEHVELVDFETEQKTSVTS